MMLIVLAFATLLTPQASAHECMYDKIAAHFGVNSTRKRSVDNTRRRQDKVHPLRIHVSTADLHNDSKYCTKLGDTFRAEGFSVDETCVEYPSGKSDVFTDEKRTILKTKILPAAVDVISKSLSVVRPTSNIIVDSCHIATVPADHGIDGVADTDYVLYVMAGKVETEGSDQEGSTIAYAVTCQEDDTGRPIAGLANFGPKDIAWEGTPPTLSKELSNADQISTAVHEIFHALGFTGASFTTTTDTLRGKPVKLISTPKVVEKTRAYFGCDTMKGAELEDQGGSGTVGSHLDKRMLFDDMMTSGGGTILSEITLAVFEDIGHFTPNYTNAGKMTFGKGAGCGFSEQKCNVDAGGKDSLWCFAEGETCTHDYRFLGYCPLQEYHEIPDHFRYFSNTKLGGYPKDADYCPRVRGYNNRFCGSNAVRPENVLFDRLGHYFGDGGMCFNTEKVQKAAGGTVGGNIGTTRCLKSRCNGEKVQFQVDGSSWYTCESDGQVISLAPAYKGTVTCPVASHFCVHAEHSEVTEPACETPCSHGTCNAATARCDCDAGWGGTQCDQGTCSETPCSHGTCNAATNKCDCNAGWSGNQCDQGTCSETPCSHGTCNAATNKCDCDAGWIGNQCDQAGGTLEGCSKTPCSRGTCNAATNKCVCEAGWSGAQCDQAPKGTSTPTPTAPVGNMSKTNETEDTGSFCGSSLSKTSCHVVVGSVAGGAVVLLLAILGIIYCYYNKSSSTGTEPYDPSTKYAGESGFITTHGSHPSNV